MTEKLPTQPVPNEATEMTLADGFRRLAARENAEQGLLRRASEAALNLFTEAGEISEGQLVDEVMKQIPELDADLAFAVVDDLRSRRITQKDWTNGVLTPVHRND